MLGRRRRTTRALVAVLTAAAVAGLTGCGGSAAPPTPAATASPVGPGRSPTAPVVGLNIPWAVGLPRAGGIGGTTHDVGEWPPFAVPALRLWDSRTTWRDLEPEPGRWDFNTLDAIVSVAAAHGTNDLMLVLAGTPGWAAQRTTRADAPWIGPGSASPPTDLRDWYDYVRTVAERYRGRIATYEIGNEPNLTTFWNGTPAQWAALVAVAGYAVRTADPQARVVVDVGVIRRGSDVPAVARWAGAVAGNPYVDAVSVHVYPTARTRHRAPVWLSRVTDVLAAVGAADLPAWVTEVNVSDGSTLTDRQAERTVRRLTAQIAAAGYERTYWYAWTALGPADLIQLAPGTPGARALSQVVRGTT